MWLYFPPNHSCKICISVMQNDRSRNGCLTTVASLDYHEPHKSCQLYQFHVDNEMKTVMRTKRRRYHAQLLPSHGVNDQLINLIKMCPGEFSSLTLKRTKQFQIQMTWWYYSYCLPGCVWGSLCTVSYISVYLEFSCVHMVRFVLLCFNL